MFSLSSRSSSSPVLQSALAACRPHFLTIAAFSALLNILALTPTIYMMQVYDRVLGSGSLTTLAALSMVCVIGLGTMALLDWLRSRLLIRLTARFDRRLAETTLKALLSQSSLSRHERAQGMRRFDTLRQGLGGPGMIALFDLPWTPVFLLAAFLIHPAIGGLALVSGLLLLALAWSNERATHSCATAAGEAASLAYSNQGSISSYANEIRAMGMREAMVLRQMRDRQTIAGLQIRASFAATGHSSLIRFTRLALQSAALGLGALLAIKGSISPGAIFASTLLLSRSVAPIEQVVGGWKNLTEVRDAYEAMDMLLSGTDDAPHTKLPNPTGRVVVENLTVLTPQNERVALAGVGFEVNPGEVIGIVGLSGSGKSTLLRALVGATQPKTGAVRYDGAAYSDWDADQIARAIGYLPQDFVLLPGTVKENISRFDGELGLDPAAIDAAVVEAAQQAGLHSMVLHLPQGYETKIGFNGVGLSAGQMQQIALARALYGAPKILILDEPNAHLDSEAEHGFIKLLSELRLKGATVIMAAHTGTVLASCDRLLLLKNGRVVRFGTVPANVALVQPGRPVSHQKV
jgi:PrtD family type I secretion system ABC transporter